MRRTIIPTLRYDDAPAAIEFLVAAFDFEVMTDHRDGDTVMHAQLTWGDGMVMLGSTSRGGEYGRLVATVAEAGLPTCSPYVIVEDVHALADRARTAGGDVVMEPEDQDHGGAACAIRDPEGNLWNFGTYDPWGDTVVETGAGAAADPSVDAGPTRSVAQVQGRSPRVDQ